MTLSVCLIARDEENNLPRALASVTDVADEIIVTDTGSTDRTVGIALDFGGHIHHFPWCDDFAAARNHCISKASKDWIFWIDADEELLPESMDELRRCLENTTALGYFVSRRDLVDAKRLDHFTRMWQLRLFRNRPDLRFQGGGSV
jgi:glycosyltransferase involved in cell wall biosynthesis